MAEALDAVRASTAPPEAIRRVRQRRRGQRRRIGRRWSGWSRPTPPPPSARSSAETAHVHADWDIGSTVRKMSDFNLTVVPVLDDEHHQLLGVVTVDDVLETILPTGWRRDFGPTAAEDEWRPGGPCAPAARTPSVGASPDRPPSGCPARVSRQSRSTPHMTAPPPHHEPARRGHRSPPARRPPGRRLGGGGDDGPEQGAALRGQRRLDEPDAESTPGGVVGGRPVPSCTRLGPVPPGGRDVARR